MGRNISPKLGEWRNGYRYYFRVIPHNTSTLPEHQDNVPRPDDGRMIVYEREVATYGRDVAGEGRTETLAAFYADGFQECLAAIYEAGYNRGKRHGKLEAQKQFRAALGLYQGELKP